MRIPIALKCHACESHLRSNWLRRMCMLTFSSGLAMESKDMGSMHAWSCMGVAWGFREVSWEFHGGVVF
eukprot:7492928-Alexandrium_andersonii.AAC.1